MQVAACVLALCAVAMVVWAMASVGTAKPVVHSTFSSIGSISQYVKGIQGELLGLVSERVCPSASTECTAFFVVVALVQDLVRAAAGDRGRHPLFFLGGAWRAGGHYLGACDLCPGAAAWD
jgi:hypothetical protein